MAATGQNATMWQGDTLVLRFQIMDNGGNPVNIAGCFARWWMGKVAKSAGADVLVKKSTNLADGIVLDFDGVFWYVVVSLQPGDTSNVPAGRWYHECEVVQANGAVTTAAIGRFTLNQVLISEPPIPPPPLPVAPVAPPVVNFAITVQQRLDHPYPRAA